MVQMITSADWPRLNTPGVTISAQLANRQPASPAIAALIVKIAVLYSRRAVAEQLDARLVLADADQHRPKYEPRIQRQSR